jgi:hypothetical protein
MTGGVSEEIPASSSSLAVSYGGAVHRLPLQPGVTTLGSLAEQLASTFGVDPQTIKLLPPKAKAAVLPSVYTEQLADEAGEETEAAHTHLPIYNVCAVFSALITTLFIHQ